MARARERLQHDRVPDVDTNLESLRAPLGMEAVGQSLGEREQWRCEHDSGHSGRDIDEAGHFSGCQVAASIVAASVVTGR